MKRLNRDAPLRSADSAERWRAHLSPEEYRRRIAEMVDDIESQAALKRQLLDLPAKGPAAIRAQEPK